MISFCREVRLPIPSGSKVSLGQVEIWRLWSDVRLTIPLGSEFRFGQSSICSIWRLWTKTKKNPKFTIVEYLNWETKSQRERERENPKLITPVAKATTGPPPNRIASRVTPAATAAARSHHTPTPAAPALVPPFRFHFRSGMCFFFFFFLSHFVLIYFNYLLLVSCLDYLVIWPNVSF